MATMVLTETSQLVSNGACFVSASGDYLMSFGNASTDWFPFRITNENQFLNYDGSFGSLNIKLASINLPVTIKYVTG